MNLNKEYFKEKIFEITSEKIKDRIFDKIIGFIKKYDSKLTNNRIEIFQNTLRYYLIICENIIIKVYRNNEYFLDDYCAIKKLLENTGIGKFNIVAKLIDIDDVNNIVILEKIELIGYNKLGIKYINKERIKELFIILFKIIYSLYKFNQQYNLFFDYSNFGTNKLGDLKIFDFSKSEYLDVENQYKTKELLFLSFFNFYEKILNQVKMNDNNELETELKIFMINFKETLTDRRKVYKPNLAGNIKKYYFFAFKFLDFEGFIDFVEKW